MKGFLFIFLFFLAAKASAQAQEEQKIRSLLTAQASAWNRGDIEGFMQTYWQSDSLLFVGKSGVTHGWHSTLENYKKGYPDTAAMGKLAFDIITIKKLSSKYYYLVGKWSLVRSIGNVGGHFDLLLQKFNGRWVIVSDHSS